MKTKKGFTIVELLSVIVVLGILLVIAVPTILNARDNAVLGISNEEKRNIKEAGKMLGIDLDDYMTDVYNCNPAWLLTNCTLEDSKWKSVKVSVQDLRDYGYLTDKTGKWNGSVIVERGNDNTYKVELITD